NLAVAEDARRRGVGRALTEAMLESARDRGLRFLTLEVRESNAPARALYEKTGFRPAGVRKNYYERPREDGVILTAFFPKEEERKC
ncbi:MAG: GNAT family N-acetyltransferase, partial [Oscillospiraceae bacterium]|nr:GNAT family N-acetyltransferase [Oscillospiraceae bacterium]